MVVVVFRACAGGRGLLMDVPHIAVLHNNGRTHRRRVHLLQDHALGAGRVRERERVGGGGAYGTHHKRAVLEERC